MTSWTRPKSFIKLTVLIFLALQQSVAHPSYTKTGLQFGQDEDSFILFKPDMSPVSEALSLCAWVKRGSNHLSNYQYWLSYVDQYNKNELVISDTGHFFLFKGFTSRGGTDLSVGEWHHLCLTWWFPSLVGTVYYDGVEIASATTRPGRKLRTSGTVMLGQLHKKYGGGGIKDYHFFGGELLELNIFSKQLTSGQISEMYAEGLCSSYSQRFGADLYIGWKDILQLSRNGTITETSLECHDDHPPSTSEPMVSSTHDQYEYTDHQQYTDLLEEVTLVPTALSTATTGITTPGVPNTSTENSQLADIFANIEGQARLIRSEKANKWGFLYESYFYRQQITESFLASLITRLDMIVEYFGRTVEETLINDDFIVCMGQRLDLLIEFFGHTLDDNLIGHLENHHATGSNECSGFLWSHLTGIDF